MQDYLTPCEVLVGNADCWTSMINGWPSYFNINPVPPITYWWIWMPLQEVTISIGTHTRSGSTMINTPWHVKIDTQELFFFMILPVGGTWSNWSSCLIEGKAWTLYRCTWNFWYLTTTMNALPRTHRVGVGCHWLQHETIDITALLRSDHEKQDKMGAFRTCIQSQLGWTNWCRKPD